MLTACKWSPLLMCGAVATGQRERETSIRHPTTGCAIANRPRWQVLTCRTASTLVRRSLAGWRSDDAPEIYAGVDKRERDEAGQAMVQLVTGARD